MKKILITSHGSTGDIIPLISLGKALLNAGYIVRFASAPLYKKMIEDVGIDFLHLPPDWEQELYAECMRELTHHSNPINLLRQIYRSGLSFMGELIDQMEEYIKEHDILIGSYVFPHLGILAKRHHVPFVVIIFSHNVVVNESSPPELIPALRGFPDVIQRKWNRVWWNICSVIVDASVNNVIEEVLSKKNLPRMKNFLTKPADLCLVGVSALLMGNTSNVDSRFKYTGYLRWQSDFNHDVEDKLNRFCDGKNVPVLNFGSVTFDNIQTVMNRFSRCWPVGEKLIIQNGWAGLSVDIMRDEFLLLGSVSHDQLFKHASVVIHHGGAGTTSSVLHSGKPHIIVPHFGDQFFWASEVKRLKVGLSISRKKWPELLPLAIDRVLDCNSDYGKNSERCAEVLKVEDGPRNAIKMIEEFYQTR